MTPETLQALNESIAHWERLSTGTRQPGERIGSRHCALCQIFHRNCVHCPVMEWSGQRGCGGTPYRATIYALEAATKYTDDILATEDAVCAAYNAPTFLKAARSELDFLRSLLPTPQ